MDGEDRELDYYRSVEDLFTSLRGTPHVLSPRDFQLLRSWWRDEVPLAAVSAGLTEVFARQKEREDADPVVSLSYCRHAVKRQAKRLAEMHVGQADPDGAHGNQQATESCRHLVDEVVGAADTQIGLRPAVSEVLTRTANQISTACRELPPELLDEHLFALEAAMLHDCWRALSHREREVIDHEIESAVSASSAIDEARQRSARALRDREIRLLLDLPRLELGT